MSPRPQVRHPVDPPLLSIPVSPTILFARLSLSARVSPPVPFACRQPPSVRDGLRGPRRARESRARGHVYSVSVAFLCRTVGVVIGARRDINYARGRPPREHVCVVIRPIVSPGRGVALKRDNGVCSPRLASTLRATEKEDADGISVSSVLD